MRDAFSTLPLFVIVLLMSAAARGQAAPPPAGESAEVGQQQAESADVGREVQDTRPPSPSEQSIYERELQHALASHARGDLEAAWESMERAHSAKPSARTLRGLGVIALARGEYVRAAHHLQASLEDARLPLTPELRRSVEAQLDECWSHLVRLRPHLVPSESALWVDGAAAKFDAPGELWLEAGTHTLEVRASGFRPHYWTETFAAGQLQQLRIVLAPAVVPTLAAASEPPPNAAARPIPPAATKRWKRAQRGLLGAGLGLAAGGFSVWMVARTRYGKLADRCDAEGCSSAEARERWDRQKLSQLTRSASVLAATGGLALLSGGALYTWSLRHGARERPTLARLDVRGAGLALTLRR